MQSFPQWTEMKHLVAKFSALGPVSFLALFFITSFIMIWRLGAVERQGIEGTLLGTLIMPYCSGISNLIFAFVMGRHGGSGFLVLENCIVNNVTNLTLLLGLPAIFWSMSLAASKKKGKKETGPGDVTQRLNYLSILLTLFALLFFTGVVWALAEDKRLDTGDGLVLVGVFLFWQVFHVFDLLKTNVYRKQSFSVLLLIDISVIIACGYGVYISIENIVNWIPKTGPGVLVFKNLGWLSGLVMVIPNALLAVYYAKIGRPDIVYSSQIGDGHICIPMCIGLFAVFRLVEIPAYFHLGMTMILCAGLLHLFCLALFQRLPRLMGLLLTGTYGFFIYKGIISP
jgi:cation:H+ antiporter